jgi:spermidine/putrescine transport system substrate-binding protein
MDVVDQLHALREGALSRRAFNRSLLALGVSIVASPLGARRAVAGPGDQPTFFTWGGFDIPDLFVEYQAKHGELPNFATFGGSEEALVKLRSGFVADVSHPCLSAVPRWVATGLFQPIDATRLSNWPDVMPELYDVGFNMTDGKPWLAPFDWGQTSISYRTDLFGLQGEESWAMLSDQRHAGRLGMLASGGDAWWCGAIMAGVPFGQIDSDDAFARISAFLRAQRPLIRMYTDDTTSLEQALAAGELVAAMTWNSSAVTLQAQGVPVAFARPKEGALTWVCGVMLHKDAPHLDRAYDVIDSLISVPAGVFNIGSYGYGHANLRAFDGFDEATLRGLGLAKNPVDILHAGHFMTPQSAEWEARMNGVWEKIKAGF